MKKKRTHQQIGRGSRRKGVRLECIARKAEERLGHIVIKIGSGCKGLFDIVSVSDSLIKLIQIKANRISGEERKQIENFKVPLLAHKEIWIKKDREPWLKQVWAEGPKEWFDWSD